jgi:hypothetical protein
VEIILLCGKDAVATATNLHESLAQGVKKQAPTLPGSIRE